MKRVKVLTVLLAAGLAFTPLIAHAKKPNGKGGESQKGGLLALEDRVEADEALIAALQGQNNWAVVSSTCTILASSSAVGPVTATSVALGQCEVTFSEDVSACSATASIVGDSGGEISVLGATNAKAGDSFIAYTFVPSIVAANVPFNLTVTCP
jgi:hypothetical protein